MKTKTDHATDKTLRAEAKKFLAGWWDGTDRLDEIITDMHDIGDAIAALYGSETPPPDCDLIRTMDALHAKFAGVFAKRQARRAIITETLDYLPDDVRRVVRLHYIHGYTIDQIASQMGYCTRTIDRMAHTGLRQISEIMLAPTE